MEETRDQRDDSRGEWLRFGVLVGVLLGTVLVVWAIRPFVAGRVVPAFLSDWGGHQVSLPIMEVEQPTAQEESGVGGVVEEGETAVDSEAAPDSETSPAAESSGEATPAATDSYPAPEPTADPAASEIVHTVQRGDTLFGIAQQYHVTIEQIVAANKINNPNQIAIGDTLKIPQP
jgi:LysM repeat protein